MVGENVVGPPVPRRRRLHWDHRAARGLPLAGERVDLHLRPLPEPMHGLLVHRLGAPSEQRPHPSVAIARRPSCPLVARRR